MKVSDLLDRCEKEEWRGHRSLDTLRSNLRILRRLIGGEDIATLHYTRLKRLADDMGRGRTAKRWPRQP